MNKSNKKSPLKTIHFISSIIGVIITQIVWWFIILEADYLSPYILVYLIPSLPFGFLAGFIGYRLEYWHNPEPEFSASSFRYILQTIILSAIFSIAGIFLILGGKL